MAKKKGGAKSMATQSKGKCTGSGPVGPSAPMPLGGGSNVKMADKKN